MDITQSINLSHGDNDNLVHLGKNICALDLGEIYHWFKQGHRKCPCLNKQ